MSKEKFLMVSLEENKVKKLAQAISNDSCRKILDYLADQEGTESEISRNLNIPISTVHYNLQQLMKAGLVKVEEYHYSKKGREVDHYKLANKYIIIAPKSTFGLKQKLRSLLPVALLGIIGAGAMQLYSMLTTNITRFAGASKTAVVPMAQQVTQDAAEEVMRESATKAAPALASTAADQIAEEVAQEAVQTTVEHVANEGAQFAADQAAQQTANFAAERSAHAISTGLLSNYALWFLAGCFFTIVLIIIIEFIIYKKNN